MSEKRTCWFIDLENVGSTRLRGHYADFGERDSVYIVCSDVCNRGGYGCAEDLERCFIDVKLVFSPLSGKNALDFVLVAELSRVSLQNPDDDYVILSCDLGFDSVVAYLSEAGVSVKRVCPRDASPLDSFTDPTVGSGPLSDIQRHVLYDFIVTNGLRLRDCEQLQYLHEICQRYTSSSKKAGVVYQSLKPVLKSKKELMKRKLELGFSW